VAYFAVIREQGEGWDSSQAKGINVIGGLGGEPRATGPCTESAGNSVTSITLENNLVADVVDDVSVRSNFGQGTFDNVAALGLRPPLLTVSKAGKGTVTVTSNPPGIECGASCSHEFDDRSEVTLNATAAGGSTFNGWSGDCSGRATCTLAMEGARSATARFDVVCIVPDVRKKTLAAATMAIRRGHCSMGKVRGVYSATVKKGRVISQRPDPGARLANGAKVNLVVSKGKRERR
jgi:hypothetical protein